MWHNPGIVPPKSSSMKVASGLCVRCVPIAYYIKACAALHLLTESPPPFLRLLLLLSLTDCDSLHGMTRLSLSWCALEAVRSRLGRLEFFKCKWSIFRSSEVKSKWGGPGHLGRLGNYAGFQFIHTVRFYFGVTPFAEKFKILVAAAASAAFAMSSGII